MKKFLFSALFLPVFSLAQTVPATSLLPSGTTFATAASAANVSTAQSIIANAQNSSRFTFGVASDGGITTNTAAKFAGAEVQVAGKISKSAAAAAVGRFAMKAGSAFGAIGVGVALYDLGKELGFTLNKNGSTGVLEVSKDGVKGTDCGTSPGSASPMQQCNASWAGPCTAIMSPFQANMIPQQRCNAVSNYYGSVYMEIYDWKYVTSPSKPVTVEEFAAEIGNRTVWFSNSALARTVTDAFYAGEWANSVPNTVTGPATTPGQKTTKTDSVAKTTTTTTTVNNYAYEGANITTGATTTTTTTNNVDNSVVNQTVENTTKNPTQDAVDPVASDSPMPDQPVLYVRKYPDGIKGVWDTKILAIKATPLFSLGSQLMPNFGSSGSCPSWHLPMNLAGWSNYGSLDVAPPCFVWDFGKVVIVVSSLLLARRLIFGG